MRTSRPRRALQLICAMTLLGGGLAAGLTAAASGAGASTRSTPPSSWDWPSYGHDAQHTFHAPTTLTKQSATTLQQAWFYPTGDAVTATPTVVRGTVYVGSWDGYFYAIALRTGALRWKYKLNPQPAVTPYPGEVPRDIYSDGGLVTSSAWYEPGEGVRPDLVIFGGGYTLYALDARTGALYWEHDYTGRPDLPPDPTGDSTRIFSSPVVTDGKVIFGVDVDGEAGHRGYIVAASLATGDPVWEFQTDVDSQGQILDDGCGDVWSSGTLLPSQGLVVFGTADCDSTNEAPYAEAVMALRVRNGQLAWMFKPSTPDPYCDYDFGASANAGVTPGGRAVFLGEGSKDGSYYSLDPKTGHLLWTANVVFGGAAGGFIGTTAYDGQDVYGSTALGDYGGPLCDPSNPRDMPIEEPSAHSLDGSTGAVVWESTEAQSFAPTTVAGGMTFNGLALDDVVDVRDASSGALIAQLPLQAPCWSGISTVGDAVVMGSGTSYVGSPDGVYAFTPGGGRPVVPPSSSVS